MRRALPRLLLAYLAATPAEPPLPARERVGVDADLRRELLQREPAVTPPLVALRPDLSSLSGLRFPLPWSLAAELQSGYAFARYVYQATTPTLVLTFPNDAATTQLPSGWFLGWSVRFAY